MQNSRNYKYSLLEGVLGLLLCTCLHKYMAIDVTKHGTSIMYPNKPIQSLVNIWLEQQTGRLLIFTTHIPVIAATCVFQACEKCIGLALFLLLAMRYELLQASTGKEIYVQITLYTTNKETHWSAKWKCEFMHKIRWKGYLFPSTCFLKCFQYAIIFFPSGTDYMRGTKRSTYRP